MSLLSVSFITILLIILVLLVGSNILTIRKHEQLISNVITKGINGMQGQTLNLSCPVGQVISFKNLNKNIYRVALICGSSGTTSSTCDSFTGDQSKSFYNSNSIDLTQSDNFNLKSLEGKNSGSFVVPDATDKRVSGVGCLKGCTNIQVVGTYDCKVPA